MPVGNRFKGRRKGLELAHLAIISTGPFKRALGSSSKNKELIVIIQSYLVSGIVDSGISSPYSSILIGPEYSP